MDLVSKEQKYVRIQFGSKSLSFSDTTVDEVFNLFMNVFKNCRINNEIDLKNHCPLIKPSSTQRINVLIRAEGKDEKKHRNSKSKGIYGMTPEEAKNYFLNNYQKYL